MSRPFGSLLVGAPLARTLPRLAVPNMAASLVQSVIIVNEARLLGAVGIDALAGIALVFPLLMLAQTLSAGAIGGAVSAAVARAAGAGDRARVQAVLRGAVAIALGAASAMGVLVWTAGPAIFRALGGHDAALDAAMAYALPLFGGIALLWLFNMLAGVLRGGGDTLRPALCVGVAAAAHLAVAGELLRGPLLQAMRGAAFAYLLAYGAGLLALLAVLLRRSQPIRFDWRAGLPVAILWPVLRAGLFAGNQSVLTIAYSLVATAIVGRLGASWLAGYGLGLRLELLMIPVIFGIGGALIAIVGAHVGAGQRARAIAMAWRGALVAATLVGAIGIGAALAPWIWTDLLTGDAEVARACARYLRTVGPCYAFFALGMCLYFCSQATGTLWVPVLGALLRLALVAAGCAALAALDALRPDTVFAVIAGAMLAYGVFVAAGLRFGPWAHASHKAGGPLAG